MDAWKVQEEKVQTTRIGGSYKWPFSLGQYQNGQVSAWMETEVPKGQEEEGYKELWDTIGKQVADQIEAINNGKEGDKK